MSPVWKVVLGVGAAVVAANVALHALDEATQPPQGPRSSSFATAPEGLAAYAELLRRFDRPVLQSREELDRARLDPGATVVVLDPGTLGGPELGRLSRFVESGGRLVASGRGVATLGGDLDVLPTGPNRADDPDDALASVERVRTAGEGTWDGVTQARVLLGTPSAPLLLEQRIGKGSALLLADSSPLQNRLLGEADNAALGLELAGAGGRPVVFLESVHGYGEATGIAAIPARWWWVLGGLALAAVLHALAHGRRFGPPEREHRELPPPRAEFAEALATSLAKARPRREAVETARRVVRARFARVARLAPEAPDDAVRRAAEEHGLDPESVDALIGSRSDDVALLELGRLLGHLEEKEAIA